MSHKKIPYYDLKKELQVIKDYNLLLLYVYRLVKKFPESETCLVNSIKEQLGHGLESIMLAKRVYKDEHLKKLEYLNKAQAHINTLLVLVRLSRKMNYINSKNYTAWSYYITTVDNHLTNWIRMLIKHEKD